MANRNAIPKAQSKDRALNHALLAMKEDLDVGNGLGDPLDRKLTLRELVSFGALKVIGTLRSGGALSSGSIEVPNGAVITTPNKAESFNAVATYLGVTLTWNAVSDHTSTYAELYRSETDLFSSATLVGRDQGNQFGDRSVQQSVTYYYWIRFVTNGGIEGPLQSTSGFAVTVPLSSEALLEDLSGNIEQSHLHETLSTSIDTAKTDINTVKAQVIEASALAQSNLDTAKAELLSATSQVQGNLDSARTEIDNATEEVQSNLDSAKESLESADTSMASNISSLQLSTASNATEISENKTISIIADNALAERINTVESGVSDNNAAISTASSTLASADAALGLRIDTVEANASGNAATIASTNTAFANADTAIGERIDSVEVEAGSNAASILSTNTALATLDSAITERVDTVEASSNQNATDISSEVLARTSADSALGSRIDSVEASASGNAAAITETNTAFAGADSALAQRIGLVETSAGNNAVAISSESTASADADSALASDISTLQTQTGDNAAAISSETIARTMDDTALSERIDTVTATANGNAVNLSTVQQAVLDLDSATASSVSTLQAIATTQELINQGDALDQAIALSQSGEVTRNIAQLTQTQTAFANASAALSELITALDVSVGEDVAAIQETLTAKADKTDAPYAMWEVKTTVNELTASIGLFNNGNEAAVGINANQFYVFDGASGDAVLPFVIDGGTTYINSAFIKDASIDKAKIGSVYFSGLEDDAGASMLVGGKLKASAIDVDNLVVNSASTFSGDVASGTYSSGTTGWALFQNGNAIFEDVVINKGTFNGSITTAGDRIKTGAVGAVYGNDTDPVYQLLYINADDLDVPGIYLRGGASEYGLKIVNSNSNSPGAYVLAQGKALNVKSEQDDGLWAASSATNKVAAQFISTKGPAIELVTLYESKFPTVKRGGFFSSGEDIFVGLSCDAGDRWVSMFFQQKSSNESTYRRAQFSAGETIPTSKKLHSDYVSGGFIDVY